MMAWRALDQLVGRRLVIVQFIHLAQQQVLAQSKAVIRQQFIINYVLIRLDECQHGPDVFFIGIYAWN